MDPTVSDFWTGFRAARRGAPEEPYDVFRIGSDAASADMGARLVLAGQKTATSALPEEFRAGPPWPGALSILTDGSGRPVCVVETVEVRTIPFEAVDAAFARDYGEWDRTLATWRTRSWGHYRAVCRRLGRVPHPQMPLVCERFRVVWTGDSAAAELARKRRPRA